MLRGMTDSSPEAGTPAQSIRRQRGPLVALLVAGAVSITGNQLASIAIPWFVLQTTHSAARTGVASFFNILPVVLATLFGGALVDRLGFKRSSVLSDVASGVAVALIPILYATGGLQYWQLLALIFLGALLDAPGGTARNALTPELAAAAGLTLEQAASATQAVERASRLVGAPLGGVLIAAIGIGNVLWLDAASFAVSAALVAWFVPARRAAAPAPHTARTDYWGEVRAGLAFILGDPLIRAIVLVVMVTNLVDATTGVAYVAYAEQRFHSATPLGLMLGLSGGGAAVGALAFAAWGKRLSRRAVFVGGFLLLSLFNPVLALFPPLWALLVFATFAGVCAGPLNPIIDAVLLERIPTELRGRVLGAVSATAWVAMPAGALLGGYALEGLGLRATLLAAGALALATTTSLLFNRSLAGMERGAR